MSKRSKKTTLIQEVIVNSGRLAKMPHDSKLLAKLDSGIKSILGGRLADHCQIGKIEANILIYYVDSPMWAHTFRMSKNNVLQTLHSISHGEQNNSHSDNEYKALRNIVDIQIRVRPRIYRPAVYRKTRKPLPKFSKAIAQSIEDTANTFNNEELAELWRNFAKNHSQ